MFWNMLKKKGRPHIIYCITNPQFPDLTMAQPLFPNLKPVMPDRENCSAFCLKNGGEEKQKKNNIRIHFFNIQKRYIRLSTHNIENPLILKLVIYVTFCRTQSVMLQFDGRR
jgi:hypothetical protein